MQRKRNFICRKCGKHVKEDQNLKGFENLAGEDVSLEYDDLCNKCGMKAIRLQMNTYKIFSKMQTGEITDTDVKQWQSKEISNREFYQKLNHKKGEIKSRKQQMIQDLKNKSVVKAN